MKAALYRRFGPAEAVLEVVDLPTPDPGPGEVLVEVHASAVNPSDVKLRAGLRPGAEMSYDYVVPHSDGAGVVAAVGTGVDPARVGQRVWLWNGQWQRQHGTAASHILLPAEQAVALPDPVSVEHGAMLGIPAMTAWAAVMGDGPVGGQTVLVTGAAGRVGRYAVQMARLAGARVIATVSAAKAAGVSSLVAGPHEIIDYRTEDVAARVMEITRGQGVARIVDVDFAANLAVTQAVLAPGGTVVGYASSGPHPAPLAFTTFMFRNQRIWTLIVYLLDPIRRRLGEAQLTTWLSQGLIEHDATMSLPLSRIAEAHTAVEASRPGGVLVTPD
ncbi:MAG: NADPH:quinone reductase [Pseudomonadota bacterium]